jgi:hypothetical protein
MSQTSAVQGHLDLFGWKAIGDAIERHSQPQHLWRRMELDQNRLVRGQPSEAIPRLEFMKSPPARNIIDTYLLSGLNAQHLQKHQLCQGYR